MRLTPTPTIPPPQPTLLTPMRESEVDVVHEDRAQAFAGKELAGEGVARRYRGTARRTAGGVDR